MVIENGKFVMYAFHEYETEEVLKQLSDRGIDTSKCRVCGKPIRKTERSPYFLMEKIRARVFDRQYYSWNVGAIDKKGVMCKSFECLLEARDERI